VKARGLPFKIEVVLLEPSVRPGVRHGSKGTGTESEVTVPLLRKVDSIQRDVGRSTGLVNGVCLEAQSLGRVSDK